MANVSTYLSRIIAYYRNSPKFNATVGMTLQPLIDLQNFLESLPNAFNLFTATAAQLDIVGQWINLSREVQVPVPDPWFRWGDAKRGWGAGYWKQPIDQSTYFVSLDDDTYRSLLIARIQGNQWDGTSSEALAIMQMFFTPARIPGATLIVDDHLTMDTYYALSGAWPDTVTMELFANDYLGLDAAGVCTNHYINSVNNTPVFGWGVDNSMIGGWGHGSYGVNPSVILNE